MWNPHFRGVDMQLGDGRAFFEAQVAGVSPELLQRVQRLAEQETYVGRKSPLTTKNLLEVTDGLRRPPF